MIDLLSLFANNILPIFIGAGAGFLLSKFLKIDPRPISHITFYILIPCLIFNLLTTSDLNGDEVLRVIAITIISVLIVGVLAWGIGKALRFERRLLVALLLGTMFGNAGNFGLSVNKFAFGDTSLAYASLYFVTVTTLTSTLGVVLASLGTSGLKEAFSGLVKVPVLYAVAVAVLFNIAHWKLPLPVDRAVSLLGDATIPMLILMLGIQLHNSQWDRRTLALGVSNSIRLVASPLIALGFVLLFGMRGAAMQAIVTQSGTPTMVMTTLLATEYDVEPSFVTAAVFTSTLLSPLTMTPLLSYLGA
jgi:predicted permease